MNHPVKILVIIPCYNEEANIVSTVERLRATCPQVDFLIINDCSTDRSAELLAEHGYPFLDLPVNLGIGGGVQCGYRYARTNGYDVAVQMDGDGQHDPAYLEKLIAARRAQARYFAPDRDPYEVLLDRYEKGLTIAQCDEFFATLRETIVPLLADIQTRGKAVRTDFLDQEWPIDAQRLVSKKIMELWGLDPAHCYLAESEHPFTTEFWRGDVRITTHYMPRDIFSNLYSVAHEGGHALYELNINPDYDYTVVTHGATMGIHESQSRLFENLVGRSRAFVHYLYPTLKELFPSQLADVSAEEIWRAVNRAEPGLIRTEADELTYSLHIMVRYELEKALMQGTLAVADLPAAWNAKYKEYLGVDVPDDAHGCLQDIHWSMGDIGYFPSYALGSAYGAQALDDLRKTNDFDAQWANGDVEPLKAALKERVWQWGSMKEPAWLVESLCGGKFDPHHFTDYLKKKYTELYEL